MDIYCLRCGEPWELSHVAEEMNNIRRDKGWNWGLDHRKYLELTNIKHCPTCGDKPATGEHIEAIRMLQEVEGHDADGYAAALEDFGL